MTNVPGAAFAAWFGDSKVVAADGAALVVYHGSPLRFAEFETGGGTVEGAAFFTANEAVARQFAVSALEAGVYDAEDDQPQVYPVFLSVRNPLVLDAADVMQDGCHSFEAMRRAVQRAKRSGHDGLWIRSVPEFDDLPHADQWAVFRPEQIKSAVANSGGYRPDDPDIFHSVPPDRWFCDLSRQIDDWPVAKAPAAQWRQFIDALPTRGVSPADIEWSGLREWLALQRGRVAKQAVLECLATSGVSVRELVKGEGARTSEADRLRVELDAHGFTVSQSANGTMLQRRRDGARFVFSTGWDGFIHEDDVKSDHPRMLEEHDDSDDARAAAKARRLDALAAGADPYLDPDENHLATRYSDYTLPGGENYREVLLMLPPASRKPRVDVVSKAGDIIHKAISREAARRWIDDHQGMPAARQAQIVERTAGQPAAPEYRSSHWHERNILAHIRLNDRTDAAGKRVLFVEEVQSDWAQEGRKAGFDNPVPVEAVQVANLPGLKSEYSDFMQGWSLVYPYPDGSLRLVGDTAPPQPARKALPGLPAQPARKGHGARIILRPGVVHDLGTFATAEQARDAILAATVFRHRDRSHQVGEFDALYLDKQDAQAGAKKAGIPLAPFVARTDGWLSLALKRVVKMAVDGGYDRVAFITGQQSAERYGLVKRIRTLHYSEYNGRYWLAATLHNGAVHAFGDAIEPEKIQDHVGKDMAERILGCPGERGKAVVRSVCDLDLKFGGEGMKAFYDQIVPRLAADLLRKLGGGAIEGVRLFNDAGTQPGFAITDAMRTYFARETAPADVQAPARRERQR